MITSKQVIYLLLLQTFFPFLLDSGINAAIAYAMYNTTNDPLSLWLFPQPLAGDLFVTTLVQCILTWILVGIFVRRDIRVGNISTIELDGKYNLTNNSYHYQYKYQTFVLFHMRQLPLHFKNKKDLWLTAKSIIILILLSSIIFVIPSLIILAAIALNDKNVDGKLTWKHMIIAKAVFGGSMALFINPLTAFLALCSNSVAHRTSFSVKNPIIEEEETQNLEEVEEEMDDENDIFAVKNELSLSQNNDQNINKNNSKMFGMDNDENIFDTVVQMEITDEHL